jgi:hypothetical protein
MDHKSELDSNEGIIDLINRDWELIAQVAFGVLCPWWPRSYHDQRDGCFEQ